MVSGGGQTDGNIILSVLPDQFGHQLSREQEVTIRRHTAGILAISVLNTNMAVLGQDNRLSLWVLGIVNNRSNNQGL